MQGIIYKTTNLVNGKIYIGQHHCKTDEFDGYLGSGVSLTNAVRYYGPENFKRETLRVCDTQLQLDAWEMLYIKKLRSTEKGIGYNILPGTANQFGSGSPMLIPEVAVKVSRSLKKTFKNRPELMKRIHQKRQITLDNTDYKERISKSLKGRYVGEKNPNYGNRWTAEQKANLSAKMRGRYNGENNPNWNNRWPEERRRDFGKKIRDRYEHGYTNPMQGKVRITNGEINTTIPKGAPLPGGFWYGMKPRKK